MTIKTFNIKYDTDGDLKLAKKLPQNFIFAFDDVDDVENNLADKISDETGFCVFSCDYEILGKTKMKKIDKTKLQSFVIDVPELHYTRYTLRAKDLNEAYKMIDEMPLLSNTTRYERTFDRNEKEWILIARATYDKKSKEYKTFKYN